MGIDYYFHHKVISASGSGDYFIINGSHPVVFVGGYSSVAGNSGPGSHGSYPVKGRWADIGPELLDVEQIEDFVLYQNYPNPFNPSTTISYHIPESGNIKLQIFNMIGQLVTTLVDEYQPVGKYNYYWDGSNGKGEKVSTGIYFCNIQFSGPKRNEIEINKMIFIK